MKIILLAVTSVDGFITRKNDPDIYKWTSVEDQALFLKKLKKQSSYLWVLKHMSMRSG